MRAYSVTPKSHSLKPAEPVSKRHADLVVTFSLGLRVHN